MEVTDHDLDAMDDYRKARKSVRNNGSNPQKKRKELIQAKADNLERVVQCEYEAWRLRTMGKRVDEIADIMQTTQTQVNVWLRDALMHVRTTTRELIEMDRELELSRTETLVAHYLPLALHDSIVMERIQAGEMVGVEDFEQPIKCAYIVMELIKLRAKLKGLVITQAELSLANPVDVMGWLRTQHEFIKSAAQAAPRDVLTLETDEPIDTIQSADQRSPETVPDAV